VIFLAAAHKSLYRGANAALQHGAAARPALKVGHQPPNEGARHGGQEND
jgi:hypothetical protein